MEREGEERHCREVRELMEGRPPFVTRHGITLALMAMAVGMAVMMMTDGQAVGLARGMAENIVRQFSEKTVIPSVGRLESDHTIRKD